MRTRCLASGLAIAATMALFGCGSDQSANDYQPLFKGAAAALNSPAQPLETVDPAAAAALRAVLQQDGQPIYLVAAPALNYLDLMAPYGQNADVTTWASAHYESISLRQGMLIATRGFGQDLMSSAGPSVAQIAAGHGTTQRRYLYLDGADQTATLDFSCDLWSEGNTSITILARSYATRKVVETCVGPTGAFRNEFWFDHGTNLRQSRQMFAPGMENILMQRVID